MKTRVYLLPSGETSEMLSDYVRENDLVLSPKRLHSTLVYSRANPIFFRENVGERIRSDLPIFVPKDAFSLKLFGERGDNLVLAYESEGVRNINSIVVGEALRQMLEVWPNLGDSEFSREVSSFPENELGLLKDSLGFSGERIFYEFNPHITLSKDFRGDISKLRAPGFPLVFDDFLWTCE